MWIGYSLDRQCGRESVLNGARGGGGVGSQYHWVGPRPGAALKIYKVAETKLCTDQRKMLPSLAGGHLTR